MPMGASPAAFFAGLRRRPRRRWHAALQGALGALAGAYADAPLAGGALRRPAFSGGSGGSGGPGGADPPHCALAVVSLFL